MANRGDLPLLLLDGEQLVGAMQYVPWLPPERRARCFWDGNRNEVVAVASFWGLYPPCDIDKVPERGETWPVDPEMREAFDRLGVDLRGEIQTATAGLLHQMRESEAGTRAYVDDRIQVSAAGTRAYTDDRMTALAIENRRHFEVIAESLRGDVRGVAEGVALLSQRMDRRDDEQAGRTGGLEGRVLRLEVRVAGLEDHRKPRRPRRRR